ncbi:hypothetical protein HYDPIDRAFT_44272 [Hydnomerulius pinastri MD-312]|uniref:Isopenicillin N synthase-like Fe(2+) 2OG dioxygenase domain-containing protein n=1 Tax=Hydnomerulius pinastri MD-312 TaxID=994086 RepID=A0A0C9W7N4_9AGAM|nr:hypothetical protein HYDPIDRAFT_44272 [Hydnomerulius pinastri MD-312]
MTTRYLRRLSIEHGDNTRLSLVDISSGTLMLLSSILYLFRSPSVTPYCNPIESQGVSDNYKNIEESFLNSRTEEEEQTSKNVWLKGHTDIGSVTILWSQPVGWLQILSPDGKQRWVCHIDNAPVINTGDTMDFTGGFYKPTIHRVIRPPTDQSAYDRLGAFYFTMAYDDDHCYRLPKARCCGKWISKGGTLTKRLPSPRYGGRGEKLPMAIQI